MVLTNAAGLTLYTFAKDSGGQSACYGGCAKFWPPVLGKPRVAAGVSLNGKFGTTTRKNGQVQVTYNGHPLYTFAGDSKPGDTHGNGSTQDGGLWKVITTSASGASGGSSPAPSASSSGGGGSGGYGY
jgi:predicted lipoprotein with Yx(FWY)xxD motif